MYLNLPLFLSSKLYFLSFLCLLLVGVFFFSHSLQFARSQFPDQGLHWAMAVEVQSPNQ